MGGGLPPPPPPPPLLFRFIAEIELHPYLNQHFFERPISRENAARYAILGNLCNPCMSVCMHFFEHHRGSHPRQPSRCLLNSIATPPLRFRFSTQRFNCTPSCIINSSNIMGGSAPPPPPTPLLFRLFAEIELHPYSNHHFFEHRGGGGGSAPPNPAATF